MKAVPGHRYVLFLAIVLVGCLLDLGSKSLAFSRLGMPGGRPWWIWDGVGGFQTSLNQGALFGMGQGKTPLFAALSIGAVLAITVWLFVARAACDRWLTVALGLVTGGILGNLYDRLGLPGLYWPPTAPVHLANEPVYAVRDFILVMIGHWPWPTFNLADSLLVCGAGLLILQSLWREGAASELTAVESP